MAPTSADVTAAWREFCDSLADAASAMQAEHLRLDERDVVEALRFLGRLTRTALHGLDPVDDPYHPRFSTFGPPDVTFGIPNPDNVYQRCSVDPDLEYRITGRRNTIHFLGFGAQAPGRAARPGTASHLDHTRLACAPDGTFEIAVSARRDNRRPGPQSGNWIELTPDARSIMVRQTFLHRDLEEPAELAIECLHEPPAWAPVEWDDVTRRISGAAMQVRFLTQFWPEWVGGFASHADVNAFFIFDEETHLGLGGDPQVRTPLCRWRIAESEALVITLRPPRCDYWNVQLATIWTEPIEAAYPSCRNASEVRPEADGSVRVVVADRDPGVPNWLDTGGHRQGTISVRWVNADAHPIPETAVVSIDAVGRV